jgi:prephenate dehydrogenase
VARIPAKHGQDRRFQPDHRDGRRQAGRLARLLLEIGHIGVNMEDLRLEHSPGQISLAEISVVPEAETGLVAPISGRGWHIAQGGRVGSGPVMAALVV